MCFCSAGFYVFGFQNLRRMEGDMKEPGKDLDELQNSDWVRRRSRRRRVAHIFNYELKVES